MSVLADVGTIIGSTLSGDITFSTVQAYRSPAAWLVFAPLTVLGGLLVYWIYQKVPFLDRHLERGIVVWTYIVIALIIFVGVLQPLLAPPTFTGDDGTVYMQSADGSFVET